MMQRPRSNSLNKIQDSENYKKMLRTSEPKTDLAKHNKQKFESFLRGMSQQKIAKQVKKNERTYNDGWRND